MFITVTGGSETFVTCRTREGFITRVGPHVRLQVTPNRKRLLTNLTRERFHSGVRAHVSFQIDFLGARLSA